MTAVGIDWDEEADLVVLGSGGGGLAGAVTAAVEGASVILLEKSDLIGGTTALSGGGFWVPVNHHMAEAGVPDSREEALEYLRACAGATTEDEILVTLVDDSREMLHFMEDKAGVPAPRPWPAVGPTVDYRGWLPGAKHGGRTMFPGKFALSDLGEWASSLRIGSPWTYDRLDYYGKQLHLSGPGEAPPSALPAGEPLTHVGSGTALIGMLFKAALDHGVRTFVETPAEELVVDESGVIGVRATREGKPFFVRSTGGVLIATGGYAWNEELKRLWMRRPLVNSCEVVDNQGDGILMGLAAGAQSANLGDAWWMPQTFHGPLTDGKPAMIPCRDDRSLPHSIIVNAVGRRFVNEVTNYYDFGEAFGDKVGAGQRNLPAWLVFDQSAVECYALFSTKVDALGGTPWLASAPSVGELAQLIGVDSAALSAEVDRFNGFVETGVDLDFGRGGNPWDLGWGDPRLSPNPCLGSLTRAPFFAVSVFPGALATCGGLRVDASGRVLSALPPFKPIPHLYAAGNCSNGLTAGAYPGAGATIGAAMTFGYLAGQQVARGVDR